MGTNGFLVRTSPQFWEGVYGTAQYAKLPDRPPEDIKKLADLRLLIVQRHMQLTFPDAIVIHSLALQCAGVRNAAAREHFITGGHMDAKSQRAFNSTLYLHMLAGFEAFVRAMKEKLTPDVTAVDCFRASVVVAFLNQTLAASNAGDGTFFRFMFRELHADLRAIALQLVQGQDPQGVVRHLPNEFKHVWQFVIGLGHDDSVTCN